MYCILQLMVMRGSWRTRQVVALVSISLRPDRYRCITPNHVTQADLVDPPVLIRLCERGAEPLLETNLTILITRCRIAWLFRLLWEQKIASSNLATETRRKITVSGGVWPSPPVWGTGDSRVQIPPDRHQMHK
jgi:hypothetical protein